MVIQLVNDRIFIDQRLWLVDQTARSIGHDCEGNKGAESFNLTNCVLSVPSRDDTGRAGKTGYSLYILDQVAGKTGGSP